MLTVWSEARVAVVGATGAVGREALAILAEWGHPIESVRALATEASAGQSLAYGATSLETRALTREALAETDVVLLAAGAGPARELAPELIRNGRRVVDNSSAFRMDPEVPLVVPEINGDAVGRDTRLVANPNCSAILMLIALDPLRRAFGLERVVVSTYQAVSGAGLAAMRELEQQTRDVLDGGSARPDVFPEPCAFNVFPHESALDPATGLNEEETKMIREAQRVWADPELIVAPTCARVPVMRSHCQSLLVTLSRASTVPEVRAALAAGPGIEWHDADGAGTPPTALRATGTDGVHVGRLRGVPDGGEGRTFALWLAGDQLRKGAALNALQIARLLVES